MNKMDEFIAALRKGKGYSWIATYGHTLSKEELCSVIKEYDYAIHISTSIDRERFMYGVVADSLEEEYGED